MIKLRMNSEDRLIELGCGNNPNPDCQVHVDVRSGPGIDFVADFNLPLPIKDQDFDGLLAQYVLEHVSWRNIRLFISEMLRILKPGGKAMIITANTEAQIQWIKDHPEGWDGKSVFDSCSCVLFGDLDYPENSHKAYLSPTVISQLFKEVGFNTIIINPYGERNTDMVIEAIKEVELMPSAEPIQHEAVVPFIVEKKSFKLPDMSREEMFDKHYFNGGQKVGGYASDNWGAYRDFPVHEITASKILAKKPESVLEIGCGRGYLLKRIQDAGIRACGLEISKHCYMTRIADGIVLQDLCKVPWAEAFRIGDICPIQNPKFDLCLSISTLEHIPEEFLPAVIGEMSKTCQRGLHGVDFGEKDDSFDKTHCSLHSKNWWYELFNKHAPEWPVEIIDKEDLEKGELSQEILKGDGKVKLNIGSFVTMHHHGWSNLDIHDLSQYAQTYKYNFLRCDIRQGIPFPTGEVDLIHMCIKPGGLIRTKRGMIPIERVTNNDTVLTHLGRWRKVTKVFCRTVDDEKITEVYGPCQSFSLTGNHEMFVQKHRKDRFRVCHYNSSRQWIPASFVETNDRILIPFPPLEGHSENLDLAEFVNTRGSEVVHEVLSSRKNGLTYDTIMLQHNVSKMQVRKWISRKSIPRKVFVVDDTSIRYGRMLLPRYINMSEDFGRFLGYLISDGWADGKQFGFGFSSYQESYVDDVIHLVRNLFGLRPTKREIRRSCAMWEVLFCCKGASIIFKKIMGSKKWKCGKKRIPDALLRQSNIEFIRGLVVGLWRGDGCIGTSGGNYTTVDRRLAYQLQEIMFRLGIVSRIGKVPGQIVRICGNRHDSHTSGSFYINVSGKSFRLLADLMGVARKQPNKTLKERSFVSLNGIEAQVKIREGRYSGKVYNLEVEEDQSYTVNGVAVHNCHSLEHLTYKEGLSFLKECRRVLKSDGCMRIIVPDAQLLTNLFDELSYFDEINDECANSSTSMAKLWSLLFAGHQAAYDSDTLCHCLKEAGFVPKKQAFRQGHSQILKETLDMLPCLSLYMEASPLIAI